METNKDYRTIAEELEKTYTDTRDKATQECIHLLNENDCVIELKEEDTDYDVTLYEGRKICSLRGAFLTFKNSEVVFLRLYCYSNKKTYTTTIINTNLSPTTLLKTLAAKVQSKPTPKKKAKLVTLEIITRVIVNDSDPDEVAVQKAWDKIAKDPMGYMDYDNVIDIEDDDEIPYDPERDDKETM